MIFLRKFIAGCIAVLAGILACFAISYVLFEDGHIDRTIQNAHQIEKAFSEASTFIDGFAQFHGRLPSETEFSDWAATQPENAQSARYFRFITSSTTFPDEIIEKFGKPTDGSYILQYWRGEWFEYYASWVKKNTLELDPRSFYLLGSSDSDGIALFVISLLVGMIAKAIWPLPKGNVALLKK